MTPLACEYVGYQHGCVAIKGFDLYTILDPTGIPGHPYGSTVALETMTEAGYEPVVPIHLKETP